MGLAVFYLMPAIWSGPYFCLVKSQLTVSVFIWFTKCHWDFQGVLCDSECKAYDMLHGYWGFNPLSYNPNFQGVLCNSECKVYDMLHGYWGFNPLSYNPNFQGVLCD